MSSVRHRHLRVIENLIRRHSSSSNSSSRCNSYSQLVNPPQHVIAPTIHYSPLIQQQRRNRLLHFSTTQQELPPDDTSSKKSSDSGNTTTSVITEAAAAAEDESSTKVKSKRPAVPKKKRKPEKTQKAATSSLPPQLLQLRNPHARDTIEDHFEQVALRTELSKLKFISKLRDKLVDAHAQHHEATLTATSASSYWKTTQQFLDGRKSIPTHVKNAFWNLIIAPTGKQKKKLQFPSETIAPNDIQILLEAREAAVQQPIFWNHKHKHRLSKRQFLLLLLSMNDDNNNDTTTDTQTKKQLQKDTLDSYLAERSKLLSELHSSKSSKEQTNDARLVAQSLRSHLPPSYYQKLMTKLRDYVKQQQRINASGGDNDDDDDDAETSSSSGRRRTPSSFSASSLHTSAHTHFHHIAPVLMDLFYLNVADDDDHESPSEESSLSDPLTATVAAVASDDDILSSDNTIINRQDVWRESRDEFVSAFQTIQAILVEEHEQNMAQVVENGIADDEAAAVDWSLQDEEEGGLEEEIEDFDSEERVYDESEESVMATFQEAAKLPPGKEPKETSLLHPRHYVVFEAISVGELGANPQEPHLYQNIKTLEQVEAAAKVAAAIQAAPTDQLVFVDNLPIDISEETLMDAYSRCGPIEAIQVHHRKPDLDPGRKSEDSKKKIRKPSKARQIWQRPRTPLYATILYRDVAGAEKASVDPLRIFGMVLDKHLIRSHRASDMNKLYLEDISKEHDVTSIEYELSQILHPSLYVCLDIERRRQKRIKGRASCEIKFPDFESTHWAYSKLSADLTLLKDDDECSLHWMPTPRDALLYWTRQLNF
jgi:hypothetical protein